MPTLYIAQPTTINSSCVPQQRCLVNGTLLLLESHELSRHIFRTFTYREIVAVPATALRTDTSDLKSCHPSRRNLPHKKPHGVLVADTNGHLLKQSAEPKRLRKIHQNELSSGPPCAAVARDFETAREREQVRRR